MSDPNLANNPVASAAASSATTGPAVGERMLSTITDTGLSLPQGYSPPAYDPGGDPLAGGIDFVRVWHAFRRRWLPATAFGIALAGTLAALVWLLLPKGYEAVAWLRVRANPGSFTGGGGGGDYEQYRKTQLQLIKSPFVLTAALRRPGISSLAMLADEKDPVGWLTNKLQVSAPSEAEVVQVRLRGPDPREITQIVNAVTQAYLTDVVSKEKTERLARRDMLEKKYKENMAEVRTRLETFNNLARSVGSRDSAEVATQRSLLLDHLGTLRTALVQFQRDLAQIDTELSIVDAHARGDIPIEDTVSDEVLESIIMRSPQVAELTERLAALEETMAFQAERSRRGYADPAVRRMMAQREELAKRIEAVVASLRPQVAAQAAAEVTGSKGAVQSPVLLRMRRQMLAQQIEETSQEFDQVAKEVTALGNANADLEARRNEIEQLQAVTNQMGIQLNASEVDIAMPNRVELLEEARVPGDGEELFRWMLTSLAGLAGFAAGVGAVILFEYLRDRLSTAEQVPQRLGLRVLGTVPRISRSRKKPNVGEVAESVDGVRTIISQTGISQTGISQAGISQNGASPNGASPSGLVQVGRDTPKVMLVTSAMEHEGKTTFAAQFAASLARAGHRTLLLDGDLRHPNVHLAMDLDLRSGLPELLRGEITLDEAVQPTSIEGLFALTGGACDYASITALSKPETGRIFKELRGSFDHVVIDAGPVLAFADVLLLGQLSDAAILVTMRDVSRVPLLNKAIDRLRSVGIRVIGSVVNGVTDASPRQLYASPVPS